MITADDFRDAMAKCQAVNHPNETAYILLAAATYMIDREADKTDRQAERAELRQMIADIVASQGYSSAAPPLSAAGEVVTYQGETDFAKAVHGKPVNDVIEIFDELMTAVSVHKRNLYNAALNRLIDLK